MPAWLQLMIDSFPTLIKAGLYFTVPLTLVTFACGLGIGLITAIIRLYGPPSLVAVVRFYVWLIRGTPLLVQLFLIFYGFPKMGLVLDAFPAAIIGFSLSVGAYTSEIIRAAITSVPQGQWHAAYSIGMTWRQTMRWIILPQGARVAVPPLANSFISLVKDTSLAAVVTIPEVFQAAQTIVATTYDPLTLYTETALIYLVFCSVLSWLQGKLETFFNRHITSA